MARPAVLLLHAFPFDARMWDGIRPALEDAGFEAVAPDLPGADVELGFDKWSQRVLELVADFFVPVGSSMGGYLAFELWRRAPERIAAMALVGTRATPDSPEQREARDDSIRLLGEAGREPFWDELAPRLFGPGTDPAVVAAARALALEQPITALVAAQETIRDRVDSRSALPTIEVPVLVIVGEEDRLTPAAEAEAMVAALPNARLSRIAGAGHLASLERPDVVAGLLVEFLEEIVA
ncbi:MAG TPA: alpha/beta hydrolase [Gaiellaceae bacterium]|nr:alpha/beta hydrolase [Gaiellaceae bacterium]